MFREFHQVVANLKRLATTQQSTCIEFDFTTEEESGGPTLREVPFEEKYPVEFCFICSAEKHKTKITRRVAGYIQQQFVGDRKWYTPPKEARSFHCAAHQAEFHVITPIGATNCSHESPAEERKE